MKTKITKVRSKNLIPYNNAAQWCADQTGDISLPKCAKDLKLPERDIYNWAKSVDFWQRVKELKQPHIFHAELDIDNDLEKQARISRNPEIKKLYYKKVCRWNEKTEVVHTIDEQQVIEFEKTLEKMRKAVK